MTDATRRTREPPLSPHLQVWRWHLTMLTSILHRATGIGLYVGALIAAGWALALAMGPEAYATYKGLLGAPLGLVVMFGLTLSWTYHLANGVRHLVWDTGHALDVKSANASAALVLAFALAATISLFGIAAMTGAI
jgi:succinate dehydrogenase / fumarate reductase cytochrome b subunit